MSFLDNYPINWTEPEPRELQKILRSAFPMEYEAREISANAGLEPAEFPLLNNVSQIWRQIMIEMSRKGELRKLVAKACNYEDINPGYQKQLNAMLKGESEVTTDYKVKIDWEGETKRAPKFITERFLEKRSRLFRINLLQLIIDAAPSVAKLNVSFEKYRVYGTGFLIQEKLILTNEHNVVANKKKYGKLQGITVEFDYQEDFKGDPLLRKGKVIAKNKDDDWAVIELDEHVDRRPFSLGTKFDTSIDDPLIIIQHPNGAFKQFALDPLAVKHVDELKIQYVADTQKGSSGSPVFNERMEVIALHRAETEITRDINDNETESIWRNEGVNIKQVMQGLEAKKISFHALK